ncbi:MAG TPA: post-COAP-1 domain-containing protein, partial [Anaerolineales bacterium]|nr:post-COAP-1 domain-containing protein [Anaerolineales bacterium]
DIGEEYITSDIWLQFDDEGNAYAMVLDAPPFASGNGWGMTLHKWESVSASDISSGDTWSDRIVINSYPGEDPLGRQDLFLDDKNTFAVNNAGPDNDGQTGHMVACWGQNIPAAIKQQTVCELSTDSGESWPGTPIPISGAQQLVIGVHVIADPNDEHRFYAVWLQYATGLAGPSTMEFSILDTTTGVIVATPPVPVAALNDIPRQFPNQQFRNLSIPIMAVGPAGELYLVYAEYRTTSDPDDEDGMQADIMMVTSPLMGLPGTWNTATPIKVNQDNTRADQFQPYVVVNPDGQVEVAYFDRRNDPDNFYVDTYLSRSTDVTQGFTDVRLSHDMSSPEFNAPVSGSGLFFGDYQGLVADACFSYPFFQDAHLANDEFLDPGPERDPDFDDGYPASPYQEAFSWRVPNTSAFGGSGADCETFPAQPTRISGGGQVPGNNSAGTASFGLNIRADSTGASGTMNLLDHGTGQHIKLESIDSVTVSGSHATITGACRIGGGPSEACQIDVEDGAGADMFELQVGGGSSYSGGGTLIRGNVQIH